MKQNLRAFLFSRSVSFCRPNTVRWMNSVCHLCIDHERKTIFYQKVFAMLLPHCYNNIVLKHVYLVLDFFSLCVYVCECFFFSCAFHSNMRWGCFCMPNRFKRCLHFSSSFCSFFSVCIFFRLHLDDDGKLCKRRGETRKFGATLM